MSETGETTGPPRGGAFLLLASVFVVAGCGLAYELVMSTAASFFLGDTVLQFSITIGLFLSGLGLGAALSRRIQGNLLVAFVAIELAVAAVGGLSATLIYLAWGWTDAVRAVTLLLPLTVGVLVGLELPLLVRILARWSSWRDSLSNVLSFDYLGGLAASLVFPLVLLPTIGVVRSALAFGVINALVALLTAQVFRKSSPRMVTLARGSLALLIALTAGFAGAGLVTGAVERRLDGAEVVASFRTSVQHVLLTSAGEETRLLLDGHLQLSSLDAARYHESLAHPALGVGAEPRSVLIIGGGDGLLAREVLRHDSVEEIVLVDIDAELVDFCRSEPRLVALNGGALDDPRVQVVIDDGFTWLADTQRRFDRILLDLPDPRSEGVARLYSVEFYRACRNRLSPGGVLATQASSPWYLPRVYWSAVAALEEAGYRVSPAHVNVPSFGEWGFAFASDVEQDWSSARLPEGLAFLGPEELRAEFAWPKDMVRPDVEPNTFDRPVVLRYNAADLRRWGWDGLEQAD